MNNNINLRNYQQNSSLKSSRSGHYGQFERELLPHPSEVLDQLGITNRKLNHGGYWVFKCPVHKGGMEKNPSLHLYANGGHFRCQSCRAKGGDILDFYCLVTGKDFVEAAKDLNAWRASW